MIMKEDAIKNSLQNSENVKINLKTIIYTFNSCKIVEKVNIK